MQADEDGIILVCDGPLADGKRYNDKEEAMKALIELSENNFNMSKYKMKKVEMVTDNKDGTYTITYWHLDKLITEKYYIM